ncbi:hypothetical protein [Listeria seeligeri]|uniref:hypothetical protein n=1 Tax=Listeria seeligeri TaxID=1640 RepID=UPI0010E2E959|nr:hypothetical protein [Listeria seeligeri]EAC8986568.1 hypothetical protein [Listeria monocytogenes]EAC9001926.1 hypothetical protein [Listeria monocytogenes]EAD0667629.1 hypothetical protein [Listeria monocytogenes]EEO3664235.1 hypothetical protein [Listeria monocytogenes]EIA6531415.1 hypothetical protein [Listeria monocytogenes]
MLIVTITQCLNATDKVNKMVDNKYIEILKPMLSIGDLVLLDVCEVDGSRAVGIVTDIYDNRIGYIGKNGQKDWINIKWVLKIYCSEETIKKFKAQAFKNFEETLENAIVNSK